MAIGTSTSPAQASRILAGTSVVSWHAYAVLVFPWVSSGGLAPEWLMADFVLRGVVLIAALVCGVIAFPICRDASWARRIIGCCTFTACHAGVLFAAYVSLIVLKDVRSRSTGPLLISTFVTSIGGVVLTAVCATFVLVAVTSMLFSWNLVRNRGRATYIAALVIGPLVAVIGFLLPVPMMLTRQTQVPALEAILFQLLWLVLWSVAFCILSMVSDRESEATAAAAGPAVEGTLSKGGDINHPEDNRGWEIVRGH